MKKTEDWIWQDTAQSVGHNKHETERCFIIFLKTERDWLAINMVLSFRRIYHRKINSNRHGTWLNEFTDRFLLIINYGSGGGEGVRVEAVPF